MLRHLSLKIHPVYVYICLCISYVYVYVYAHVCVYVYVFVGGCSFLGGRRGGTPTGKSFRIVLCARALARAAWYPRLFVARLLSLPAFPSHFGRGLLSFFLGEIMCSFCFGLTEMKYVQVSPSEIKLHEVSPSDSSAN